MDKECLFCTKTFNASVRELNRGNGRFCSISCGASYRAQQAKDKWPELVCETCQKKFKRKANTLKSSKHKKYFCCKACKDIGQRIGGIKELQLKHYGINMPKASYRKLAFRHKKHECEKCGYKKYKQLLEVHHLDRNRKNNKLENLKILCLTCHSETHLELEND